MMEEVTILAMKPVAKSALLLSVGVILGYCFDHRGRGPDHGCERLGSATNLRLEDVIFYCRQIESGPYSDRDLQPTVFFEFVRTHLWEVLQTEEVKSSGPLATMAWRAAFLYGNEDQVIQAVQVCWLGRHPGVSTEIPRDLAADPRLAFAVLTSDLSEDLLSDLFYQIYDRGPAGWGVYDYTGVLEYLMERHKSPKVRATAAYALARWRQNDVLGRKAQCILDAEVQGDSSLLWLAQSLQVLGTNGWNRNPTSRSASAPSTESAPSP